jgi:PAS domain S-box-containing protein
VKLQKFILAQTGGYRVVRAVANLKKSTIPAKPARPDTDQTLSKYSIKKPSHIRLVIIVALSVFFSEMIVMTIALVLPMADWLLVIFDASLLIVLLSPILYLFMFRPLDRHIQESNQIEKVLRENEMRFRTVFRTSPDSITVSRLQDGRIVDVNEGFSELIGYSKKDVLGKSAIEIPLWKDSQDREKMVTELQKYGYVNDFEARFIHKDEGLVDILISARVIMLNDEPHILAVSRDISELKKTEKTLLASQNFLQISNRHTEMDPLLNEFIAQIKSLTDCSAIGMRVLDENGNIPYQVYKGFSPEFYETENPHTIDSLRCMCTDVIMSKTKSPHPFLTEGGSFNVGSTSRFLTTLSEADRNRICDVCNRYGYESVALIPIHLGDKILGLIHVADPRKHLFSEETIGILEGAALQLGTAIERVRAEEALQKSHRELERRVEDRTAELVSAIDLLNIEIEERKYNEKKLLEQQDKLRLLSSELLLIEERERRQIATELHDRIGQTLAVTKIKLAELREASASNETAAKALDGIRQYIEQTIQDTRSLTFELSPPVLYELGLEAALAWLANQTREKHGLQIDLKDDGRSKPLVNGFRVIAFQIARELLFNIVKHARAKNATISIKRDDDTVRIDIEDDGIGFDSSELEASETGSRGFGLFSIRERLSPLGGHFEIESEPGRGTRASLVLPLVCDTEDSGD